MSASLVGSEMCIRDRSSEEPKRQAPPPERPAQQQVAPKVQSKGPSRGMTELHLPPWGTAS
eukprot:7808571-Alexandrium_andersonii.AAC.1